MPYRQNQPNDLYLLRRENIILTNMDRSSKCLLVASTLAPIHGGSANVYASLCRLSPPGSMAVRAARRYYGRAEETAGWKEHDHQCGYPVRRLDLLRPLQLPVLANKRISAWRYLTTDSPEASRKREPCTCPSHHLNYPSH